MGHHPDSDNNAPNERRFAERVLAAAGTLVCVLDERGRLLHVNTAGEELLQRSMAELSGVAFAEAFVPPSHRAEVARHLRALAAGSTAAAFSAALGPDEEAGRLVQWLASSVPNEAGGVRWVVCTGMPGVGEVKPPSARQEQMEAVGHLAGSIALEFNNLLTAILGYIDLNLPDIPCDTPLHDDLNQVKSAALRAAELAQRLLAVSRRHFGEGHVFDLNHSLRSMQEPLANLLPEGAGLRLDLCEEPLRVTGSPSKVEQVIMALIEQGGDFATSAGELVVRTRARAPQPAAQGPAAVKKALVQVTARPPQGVAPAEPPLADLPSALARTFCGRVSTTLSDSGALVMSLAMTRADDLDKQSIQSDAAESGPAAGATARAEPAPAEPPTVLLVGSQRREFRMAARVLDDLGYTVVAGGEPAQITANLEAVARQAALIVMEGSPRRRERDALLRRMQDLDVRLPLLLIDDELPAREGGVSVLRPPLTAHGLATGVARALGELAVKGA